MRVFVPATLPQLELLRGNGFAAPIQAHAVTGLLREWYVEGDSDELEYAAAADAAHSSLRQLAADPSSPRRRVVVAAEVPDAAVRPGGAARSSVTVDQPLTVRCVVSLHVDAADAEADVAAAAAALGAAEAGDDDAQFTVDTTDGHELLWYDVTELPDVLAPSGQGPQSRA